MVKKVASKGAARTLKVKERIAAGVAAKKEAADATASKQAELETVALQAAERYEAEYNDIDANNTKNRQQAKANDDFWVNAAPKTLLVVRIKGINKMRPKVRKVFQLLRLRQIHNAVLLKVNKATLHMLKLIEPFITYGYPTRSTLQKLVLKRGYAKINKQRIPLMDNAQIDANLGKFGIRTAPDLIHELYTVGPNFKAANNFMWPFKLSSPKLGMNCKRHSYIQGGDWGNREDRINELVKRML